MLNESRHPGRRLFCILQFDDCGSRAEIHWIGQRDRLPGLGITDEIGIVGTLENDAAIDSDSHFPGNSFLAERVTQTAYKDLGLRVECPPLCDELLKRS